MRTPPLILIVDDVPDNLEILQLRLESQGYEAILAGDGRRGARDDPRAPSRSRAARHHDAEARRHRHGQGPEGRSEPAVHPGDPCHRAGRCEGRDRRARSRRRRLPDKAGRSGGAARAGAGDAADQGAARHGAGAGDAASKRKSAELASWNRELETRVQAQLARNRAHAIAEAVSAAAARRTDRGARQRPHSRNPSPRHRRRVLRSARVHRPSPRPPNPRKCVELLREYHGALGPLVTRSEGTLDHFSGDGIMVFFNDPLPCPDPAERAAAMAVAMREAVAGLQKDWRRRGREIGFGIGIAQGYATLGQIGFAERVDYTAIGTVCNLAARLCAAAEDGQILVSRRIATAIEANNTPRTYRRHRPQGAEPGRRGVQHRRGAGIAAPPARA